MLIKNQIKMRHTLQTFNQKVLRILRLIEFIIKLLEIATSRSNILCLRELCSNSRLETARV